MTVFLTSQASRTLQLLLPYLPAPPRELSVAFIPTAADLYSEKPWLAADRQKFLDLGFSVADIDLKAYSKDKLLNKLRSKDLIFVSGGTTSYLLNEVKKSGFDQIIKNLLDEGKIYIGASAGSVLAGPDVEIDTYFDHRHLGPKLNDYRGLGLVDFVPVPHADNPKYQEIIDGICRDFGQKFRLTKINESQAILIDKDHIRLLL